MIGIIYCFSIIGTQTHNYRGEAVAVTGFGEEVDGGSLAKFYDIITMRAGDYAK